MTQDNAENETKARELLAAEYEASGYSISAKHVRRGSKQGSYMVAIRAITKALQPSPLSGDDVEIVAQTLQDYMEQHHGVCLSASAWDGVAKAVLAALQKPMTDLSEREKLIEDAARRGKIDEASLNEIARYLRSEPERLAAAKEQGQREAIAEVVARLRKTDSPGIWALATEIELGDHLPSLPGDKHEECK